MQKEHFACGGKAVKSELLIVFAECFLVFTSEFLIYQQKNTQHPLAAN